MSGEISVTPSFDPPSPPDYLTPSPIHPIESSLAPLDSSFPNRQLAPSDENLSSDAAVVESNSPTDPQDLPSAEIIIRRQAAAIHSYALKIASEFETSSTSSPDLPPAARPPWTLDSQFVCPLMVSSEFEIQRLERTLKDTQDGLSDVEKTLRQLLEQNDILNIDLRDALESRAQKTALERESLLSHDYHPDVDTTTTMTTPVPPRHSSELLLLRSRYDQLLRENKLLLDEVSTLSRTYRQVTSSSSRLKSQLDASTKHSRELYRYLTDARKRVSVGTEEIRGGMEFLQEVEKRIRQAEKDVETCRRKLEDAGMDVIVVTQDGFGSGTGSGFEGSSSVSSSSGSGADVTAASGSTRVDFGFLQEFRAVDARIDELKNEFRQHLASLASRHEQNGIISEQIDEYCNVRLPQFLENEGKAIQAIREGFAELETIRDELIDGVRGEKSLRQSADELKRKLVNVRGAMKQKRRDFVVQERERLRETLLGEKERLRQKQEETTGLRSRSDRLDREIVAAENEMRAVLRAMDRVEMSTEITDDDSRMTVIPRLQSKIRLAQEELSEAQRECAALSLKKRRIEIRHEEERGHLRKEIARQETSIESTRKQIDEAESERQRHLQEFHGLEGKRTNLTISLKEIAESSDSDPVRDLQRTISQLVKSFEATRTRVTDLQDEIRQIEQESAQRMSDSAVRIDREKGRLQSDLDDAKTVGDDLRKRYGDLHSSLTGLVRERDDVSTEEEVLAVEEERLRIRLHRVRRKSDRIESGLIEQQRAKQLALRKDLQRLDLQLQELKLESGILERRLCSFGSSGKGNRGDGIRGFRRRMRRDRFL